MELRLCPVCRDERAFERLPCADGHGADCPEVVCVACGVVLLVGLLPRDEAAGAGTAAAAASAAPMSVPVAA